MASPSGWTGSKSGSFADFFLHVFAGMQKVAGEIQTTIQKQYIPRLTVRALSVTKDARFYFYAVSQVFFITYWHENC